MDWAGLSLLEPDVLLWLLALVPLYFVVKRMEVSKLQRLRSLGAARPTSFTPVLLPLLCMGILLLSLARPYNGYEDIRVPQVGRDIMVVMDVSLSMAASDVSPSRMDLAKRKLLDLIDLVSKESAGDRLGIVLFAGDSYLFCPLTSDYAVLRTFANAVSVGLIASGGSAITQALLTAAKSFETVKAQAPALLVFSDGEDNELVVARSIDVLRGFKLSLWALGIGTTEGAPVVLQGGTLLKDSKGQIVVSKLREDLLQALATSSGGAYRRAQLDDQDLRALLSQMHADVRAMSQAGREATVRRYHEFGPLLLWIPLTLLTLLLYMGRAAILLSLLLLVPKIGHAESAQVPAIDSAYDAQRAFSEGNFDAARDAFQRLHERDPQDKKILQGLAASEFKLGKYAEAQKYFDQLARHSQTGRERFYALYDRGTTELFAKKPDEAIASLEEALRIKPDDEAARFNLELARRMKQEQQQQSQQQKSQEKQQEKEQNQQQEADQTPSPENQAQPPSEQSPSPASSPDSSDQGDSPQPAEFPTPSEDGSGSEQDERKDGDAPTPSGGDEHDQSQPASQSGQEHDPKALKEREAKAWLESLDDSPVILRRQVGNKRSSQQQSW